MTLIVGLATSADLHQEAPSAQANIHATHIASNFASEINPGKYYSNPDTKRDYYFIGSTDQGHEQTAPNVNTPVVANNTGIIQLAPNMTATSKDSNIETIQLGANKTAFIVTNAYNTLIIIADNKTGAIQQHTNETIPQKSSEGSTGGSMLQGDWNLKFENGEHNTEMGANNPNANTGEDVTVDDV